MEIFKWTLSLISSDPPCKEGYARFTTVPLIGLSDQVCIYINVFVSSNCLLSFAVSLRK